MAFHLLGHPYRSKYTFNNGVVEGAKEVLAGLRKAIPDFRHVAFALESIENAIETLHRRIETEEDEMTRCVESIALGQGLTSLPVEVLGNIFQLFVDGHGGYVENMIGVSYEDRALCISQVCHRFRAVAVNTPHLWTAWSPKLLCQTSLLSIFQQRSQSADLRLWLDRDVPQSATDILLQSTHRLETLRISYFHQIPDLLRCQSLPRLRTLMVDSCPLAVPRFHCSSDAPVLNRLKIVHSLRLSLSKFPLFRWITELEIQEDRMEEAQLDAILTNSLTLLTFVLTIEHWIGFDGGEHPEVSIPNFTSLILCITESMSGSVPLVNRAAFPNLEHFTVYFFRLGLRDVVFGTLFSQPGRFPNLLNLRISTGALAGVVLHDFASACPQLEHLFVYTHSAPQDWKVPNPALLPPLKSIDIKCAYSVDWIKGVLQILRCREGGWERFEKLIVASNSRSARRDFDLVPKEKVWI